MSAKISENASGARGHGALACLWCDAPLPGPIAHRLCRMCAPFGDTLYHCTVGAGHLPTYSAQSCGQCDEQIARAIRISAENAPRLAQLRAIRADLVEEIRSGRPWPGCNFGKAILGRAIDAAIADLVQAV